MGKYATLHSCVAPEKLELQQLYTISINPAWSYKTLQTNIDSLYKVLAELKAVDQLLLYPEHSPLGKLHYHGTIVVNDKYEFYDNDIPILKEYGSFEIDSIKDPKTWLTYCNKNESYMKVHVLRLKNRSYPLLFRSVDSIMLKQKNDIKWANHQDKQEDQFTNILFDITDTLANARVGA